MQFSRKQKILDPTLRWTPIPTKFNHAPQYGDLLLQIWDFCFIHVPSMYMFHSRDRFAKCVSFCFVNKLFIPAHLYTLSRHVCIMPYLIVTCMKLGFKYQELWTWGCHPGACSSKPEGRCFKSLPSAIMDGVDRPDVSLVKLWIENCMDHDC